MKPGVRGGSVERAESNVSARCLTQLGQLLEVAGAVTRWEDLEAELRRLPAPLLEGLRYRIERAISDSYWEGFGRGSESGGG